MGTRGVRRVVPLTLGWCEVPYAMSVAGAPGDARLREPVPALLLETDDGWVLVDTGFNPAFIRDRALRRRFHTSTGVEVWLPGDAAPPGPDDARPARAGEPEDPLLAELARVGLSIGDLAAVVITHLHNDHAGGLRHLAGTGVPIHAQRAELEYGRSAPPPGPERDGIIRMDFDDPTLTWRLADGDVRVAAGVTALRTAGHTPGHQSVLVELDAGPGPGGPGGYVFAFDAADLRENLEREVGADGVGGVSPEATVVPLRRLKALGAERGYPVIPGHDPVVWPALTAALGAPPARDPGGPPIGRPPTP